MNLSSVQRKVLNYVTQNTQKDVGTTAEMVQNLLQTEKPNGIKHLQNIADKGFVKLASGAQLGGYFSTADGIFECAEGLGLTRSNAKKMKKQEILDEIVSRIKNLDEKQLPDQKIMPTSKAEMPSVSWAYKKIHCTQDERGHLKLKLEGLGITSIGRIGGLSGLADLWSLNLDNNGLNDSSGLNTLTNLRHLHLRHNAITHISGLDTLVNLTELYLRENHLRNVGDIVLGIKNLEKLEKLGLEENTGDLTTYVTALTGTKDMLLDAHGISALRKYSPDLHPLKCDGIYFKEDKLDVNAPSWRLFVDISNSSLLSVRVRVQLECESLQVKPDPDYYEIPPQQKKQISMTFANPNKEGTHEADVDVVNTEHTHLFKIPFQIILTRDKKAKILQALISGLKIASNFILNASAGG